MKSSLTLTVYYEGEVHCIQTFPYEYRSLMALILQEILFKVST